MATQYKDIVDFRMKLQEETSAYIFRLKRVSALVTQWKTLKKTLSENIVEDSFLLVFQL